MDRPSPRSSCLGGGPSLPSAGAAGPTPQCSALSSPVGRRNPANPGSASLARRRIGPARRSAQDKLHKDISWFPPIPSLDPKLPQMMIQMLVHQDRPLLRRQWPEEAVRMCGATVGPGGYKPVDQTVQTRAFLCQVPLILDNQTFHSRRIAAQRFVVPKHLWLDDGAHDPSDQYPWRPQVP